MSSSCQTDIIEEHNENQLLEILRQRSRIQTNAMFRDFGLEEEPEVPEISFFDSNEDKRSSGYFCFGEGLEIEISRDQKPRNGATHFERMTYTLSHEISHWLHYLALGRENFLGLYSNLNILNILRLVSYQGWCEIIAQHATFDFYTKSGKINDYLRVETPPDSKDFLMRGNDAIYRAHVTRGNFDAFYQAYLEHPFLWKKMAKIKKSELGDLLTEPVSEFFIHNVVDYFDRGILK